MDTNRDYEKKTIEDLRTRKNPFFIDYSKGTPRPYEHPILGKITDDEVHLIKWDRETRKQVSEDVRKLNVIIDHFKSILEPDHFIKPNVQLGIEMLERFRDEEL